MICDQAGARRGSAAAGRRLPAPSRALVLGADVSEAVLHTSAGPVTLELFDADAPKTVENFRKLASDGFYDGLVFHRVIPDFMIQGGCPEGTGRGGPGYTFEDEINEHRIARGALAMANAGPDTNGSQFFIVTTQEAPWLDGKHTVFGHVTDGMEAVGTIESAEADAQDRPVDAQTIERVELRD
jgi:cyclophilin family peptidyl-prolyl cis-trans isomerase